MIFSAVNFNQVLYEGGTGNDLFVIEVSSDTWMTLKTLMVTIEMEIINGFL